MSNIGLSALEHALWVLSEDRKRNGDRNASLLVLEYQDEEQHVPDDYTILGSTYQWSCLEQVPGCAHDHPVIGLPARHEHTYISVWVARRKPD